MDLRAIAKRVAAGKPLTPRERKEMGLANVFLMDWEADGGTFPPEFETMSLKSATPDENRKVIQWVKERARGDFWDQ